MMTPCQTINNLEENIFIAGSRQVLEFECLGSDGQPIDLTTSTVKLLLSPFGNSSYTALVKDGAVFDTNKFSVVFEKADTVNLRGLYSFQPLIIDVLSKEHRPAQGTIQIQEAIKQV